MGYVEKRIAFDHERDSDIIEFLDSMTSHKGNQIIRELLRDYIRNREKSKLDRIEEKIDSINSTLKTLKSSGFSVASDFNDENESDDLEKLKSTLDRIGV